MNTPSRQPKSVAKKRKRTARIICHNTTTEYWTTQTQFWQWVRELKVVKLQHNPLTGRFVRQDEEKLVVLSNMVLNLAHPNHLKETLLSRRHMKRRKA